MFTGCIQHGTQTIYQNCVIKYELKLTSRDDVLQFYFSPTVSIAAMLQDSHLDPDTDPGALSSYLALSAGPNTLIIRWPINQLWPVTNPY